MTPIRLCPDVTDQRVLPLCVHLVLRIDGSWDTDRDHMVEELERRIASVDKYTDSAAFRNAFGARIPVVRVQTVGAAPSIVEYLMAEQGIEVEDLDRTESPGHCCVDCDRSNLPQDKVVMSARGWVCPCCDRARRRRVRAPDRQQGSDVLSIPAPLLWPLLVVITVGFFMGVGVELGNLGQINQSLRIR